MYFSQTSWAQHYMLQAPKYFLKILVNINEMFINAPTRQYEFEINRKVFWKGLLYMTWLSIWHVAVLQYNRCHKKCKILANNLVEFEQIYSEECVWGVCLDGCACFLLFFLIINILMPTIWLLVLIVIIQWHLWNITHQMSCCFKLIFSVVVH